MKLAATLVTAAIAICACSQDDPPEIKPMSAVDVNAWRNDLVTKHQASPTADMQKLYDVTVRLCNDTPEQMNTYVAMALDARRGVNAERIHMTYVCPSRAHMVDDALKHAQDVDKEFREICALPPSARTEDQQLMAEADGCK